MSTSSRPPDAPSNGHAKDPKQSAEGRVAALERRIDELARERDAAMLETARISSQLQRIIANREEFFIAAAHDLNTPLTALKLQIHSVLNGALKDTIVDERVRRRLGAMDRQVSHMARLVRTLLDVTRIACRTVELSVADVDLVEVAREVVDRMQPELEWARCPVQFEAAAPVVGSWDAGRLDDVIANLLSNAMKYAAGSPIEVRVDAEGDRARLSIRDHGVGIAPEDHDRIFTRFERLGQGASPPGFGLGLWIVRQIVEASGGSIRVASTVGAGALFTVELPRTGASAS